MSDLLGILEKTANPTELQVASKQLEDAAQSNLPLFLKELSKGKMSIIIAMINKSFSGGKCESRQLR